VPGNVLVDSSFLIDRLRRGEDPLVELAQFSDEYDFFTCGVVSVEVLRGMKLPKAHARMSQFLGCMSYVPTTSAVWERVAQLAWELDRAGRIMQVTDMVIAVSAMQADAAVLTMDSDFHRVPGLSVIRDLTD
jgi:predicted nucleic acid-binding protein